jgi:hypothetical protein
LEQFQTHKNYGFHKGIRVYSTNKVNELRAKQVEDEWAKIMSQDREEKLLDEEQKS